METDSLPAGQVAEAPEPAHLLSALIVLALVGGLAAAGLTRARRGAEEPSAPWIDPAGARVAAAPEWVDPRWLEHLRALLEDAAPFQAGTQGALEPLCAALGRLSFVERVDRCESGAEGLTVELTLRRPVACIPVRGEFALVDEDGVVLEGRWPLPPRLGRAYLPVLGPMGDALYERARAGDWLAEPEHTDALDVALSLEEGLSEEQRGALGRIVIDARTTRRASVDEPGVRLALEGERLALFGRAPGMDAPGELSTSSKWQALVRALELFEHDPVSGDWTLVDLRWDRPDLALRHAPAVAALEEEAPRTRSRSTRARPERDDSRPRVR